MKRIAAAASTGGSRTLADILASCSATLFPAGMGRTPVQVTSTDSDGDTPLHVVLRRQDSAAALLLMSAEWAAALGLKPLARIVSSAAAGVDPRLMGLGPIPATRKALARAGLRMADIDLVEINEAFAVQAIACLRELEIDPAIADDLKRGAQR